MRENELLWKENARSNLGESKGDDEAGENW